MGTHGRDFGRGDVDLGRHLSSDRALRRMVYVNCAGENANMHHYLSLGHVIPATCNIHELFHLLLLLAAEVPLASCEGEPHMIVIIIKREANVFPA